MALLLCGGLRPELASLLLWVFWGAGEGSRWAFFWSCATSLCELRRRAALCTAVAAFFCSRTSVTFCAATRLRAALCTAVAACFSART